MAAKPKIAFFDFAGCEGDQLQVANLEEKLLDILEHVEVVSFREVHTGHSDNYDIAFVEGSITRPQDEVRLKEIRANAKVLVALGACATIGGVNCIKNFLGRDVYSENVYGTRARWYPTYEARPLKAVVKVDVEIHGCPIDRGEFARIVKEMLLGRVPWLPDYPVCVECKKAGNVCRYHLGRMCLGIITRAGCNACCVTEGAQCWGCRGLAPSANLDAAREVMDQHGFDRKHVQDLMRFFLGDTSAPL
jgi:coenzyme F420-reducing hydrogenase gamma subunit